MFVSARRMLGCGGFWQFTAFLYRNFRQRILQPKPSSGRQADFLGPAEAEEECLVQRLRDRESKSIRNNGPVIVSGDPPDPEGCLECETGRTSSAPSLVGQPEATAVYGDF
jgi:hypothetical protein